MKYIKLELLPETNDQIDLIIDGLRTTLDREPIVDNLGNSYTLIESDEELAREMFCLGACFYKLEESLGLTLPFLVDLVEVDHELVDNCEPIEVEHDFMCEECAASSLETN